MESRRQSDDKTVTFLDLFKKQPFRNNGKLDMLFCSSCNSNKDLEIMRMPTEASKVILNNSGRCVKHSTNSRRNEQDNRKSVYKDRFGN
jgi:hypothetical protein